MICRGFGFNGIYGGPSFFMMIPILTIIVLIVYFIYKVNSDKKLSFNSYVNSRKAIEILDERFAKGEISEEEYSSKKKQILKN
ncbi:MULTISPECIES: SHOCT domain-containing protein [Clostridium]|uniref:SHOCT domain-containing protein n=1 Tax=Clostridium TaxID=1485 RepID=UPI00069EDF71|nr:MULTISPECIES: SHOCT domain-containing protein [Clostridium]KOF56521.1 hypothetical protein AGR56_07040 [Clostridium sp. DMHC 10]MCD2348848.1 SHOCT domain-containing protein [Clostridium guangxiense]